MTPNSTDIIVFCIIFIFAFLAFLKGFVKDFFSTLNLIIATIISYTLSPFISQFIKITAPRIIIDLTVQFAVFVLALIICSILSSRFFCPLSKKIPNSLNQSLGFGFGFLKGFLILSFSFAILMFFYPNQSSQDPELKIADSKKIEKFGPEWLKNSKSYNILEYGATLLDPLVNNILLQINDNADIGGQLGTKATKTKKVNDQLLKKDDNSTSKNSEREVEPTIEDSNQEKDESGYTDQEIKKMDRLIEIMSD